MQAQKEKEDKNGRKRKLPDGENESTPPAKKLCYSLTKHQRLLIEADTVNKKLWDEILDTESVSADTSV